MYKNALKVNLYGPDTYFGARGSTADGSRPQGGPIRRTTEGDKIRIRAVKVLSYTFWNNKIYCKTLFGILLETKRCDIQNSSSFWSRYPKFQRRRT